MTTDDKRDDPEFGSMTFEHDDWVLDRRIVFNGIELPVRISPEDDATRAMSDVQRAAVRHALALPADAHLQVTPLVMENWEEYAPHWDPEDLAPPNPDTAIWRCIHPTSIDILHHGEVKTPCFLIRAEVDWEVEHGLEIRFRNGVADEVGQQYGHMQPED